MRFNETVVKKEEITEEDPLSHTNNTKPSAELVDQDSLEGAGDPVKKEWIEDDEQIPVIAETVAEDLDL